MTTIVVLICVFVIPYVSMDMKAMLADLEKLVKDNEMTINSEEDVSDLFKAYAKQNGGEIKEHMAKQAVHELIIAGTLKKGEFEYAHSTNELPLLDNNALDKLAGIVKGNADEINIKKVVQYMEDHNLADIDTQAGFIGYHYAKKNHPEEFEALLKHSAAEKSMALEKGSMAEELETTAESEVAEELVPAELKTPTTEDSDVTAGPKIKSTKTKGLEMDSATKGPVADELETTAGDHSNANKLYVLNKLNEIDQSKVYVGLGTLLGIGTLIITKKLLTTDTTPNQTIDNDMYTDADMYDAKDTANHVGYSTVYILVTILIACLFITIGLSFYIVKIAYPYNTNYTSFKILL